jgi:hypothetical protein
VVECLYDFRGYTNGFLAEVKDQVKKEVGRLSSGEIGEKLSKFFDRRSQELQWGFSAQLKSFSQQTRTPTPEIE